VVFVRVRVDGVSKKISIFGAFTVVFLRIRVDSAIENLRFRRAFIVLLRIPLDRKHNRIKSFLFQIKTI